MKHRVPKKQLRVALVSVTMGQAQRGYERLFRDLFDLLKGDVDITLFKGGGVTTGARERVPRLMRSTQKLLRLLPFGRVAGSEYSEYKADCLAFTLSLLPELMAGRYDIIHLVDFPLGHIFRRCPRAFTGRATWLMTNACCMRPQHYPARHFIQEIAKPHYDAAVNTGLPTGLARFLPIGFDAERFTQRESRAQLRERYGIDPQTFVILSVAAIKRPHKRVDYVIAEAAKLHGDFLLWLDGSPEDQNLIAEAQRTLGSRCRVSLLPSDQVRDLYYLADVMVHGALEEAFGLSIVEGLSTGLRVFTHNSAHFHWLTGSVQDLIDMEQPGTLAARLQLLIDAPVPEATRNIKSIDSIRRRFDWQVLKQGYLDLYNSLCQE